jgi:hypothetical protein
LLSQGQESFCDENQLVFSATGNNFTRAGNFSQMQENCCWDRVWSLFLKAICCQNAYHPDGVNILFPKIAALKKYHNFPPENPPAKGVIIIYSTKLCL